MAERSRLSRRTAGFLVVLWCALGCAVGESAAGDNAAARDPLDSSRWRYMVAAHFRDAPVVFDERVHVLVPAQAQDPLATPVQVRVQGLSDIVQIRVIADAAAQSRVLDYFPVNAAASLGFSFTVAQATPLRAAVRTGDGVWHIGGAWVDAQGGGCATPSVTPAAAEDDLGIGRIEARSWPRADDSQRLKFRVVLPGQTRDLAAGSGGAVNEMTVRDAHGRLQSRIVAGSALAHGGLFTLDIASRGPLRIQARDNQGNRYRTSVGADVDGEAP